MNSIRRKAKVIEAAGLTLHLYTEQTFYNRLIDDFIDCKSSVFIESPFIKRDRAISLLPYFKALVSKRVRVTIRTRHPSAHRPEESIEAEEYIELLKQAGVKVLYSGSNCHRKLVILDEDVLYEGSLNVLSHFNAQEMMRRINSHEVVSETRRVLRI